MPRANDVQPEPLLAADPRISGAVFASAGTGKTWLLIARLLRLLLAGELPETILAITFTNKAAREMRDRLMRRVQEWAVKDDADLRADLEEIGVKDAKAATLERARELHGLLVRREPVRITTFHSFCVDILRLFPFDEQLPFKFEVNDETGQERMFNESLDDLFRIAGSDEPLARALDALTRGGNDKLRNTREALEAFLHHRNEWRLLKRTPEDASRDLARALEVDPDAALEFPDAQTTALAREHLELLSGMSGPTQRERECADTLRKLLASPSGIASSKEGFKKFKFCFVTGQGAARHLNCTGALIKRLHGEEKAALRLAEIEQLVGVAAERFGAASMIRRAWRSNTAWYACGERLLKIYEDKQRRARTLDFCDLEWHAERLLNREGHVLSERLAARLRHILVDEFQDTNPDQWGLLLPILKEIASQQGAGSAFVVGDVKQAIYGFRRTDSRLLKTARDWLRDNLDGKEFRLNASHRSADAVLELVNEVFGGNREDLPLSDFETHTRHASAGKGADGKTAHLPLVERPKRSDVETEMRVLRRAPERGRSAPELEADQVARLIKRLHDTGECAWDDFMVLARRRRHFPEYSRAFRKYGVPLQGAQEGDFVNALETRDMLELLRFILSPQRMLSLCRVLRSPLFNASDESLQTFTRVPGTTPMKKLSQMSDKYADSPFPVARKLLRRWIRESERLPPHDLLQLIYSQRAVIARYRRACAKGDAAVAEARLVHLLHLALDFHSGRYPHTAGFIDFIEQLPSSYEIDVRHGEDEGFVQMLTVHRAKGLEARVVVLVDAGAFKPPVDRNTVFVDRPADVRNQDPTCMAIAMTNDEAEKIGGFFADSRERHKTDRVNLLYVALTRARERVYVSACDAPRASHENWFEYIQPCVGGEVKPPDPGRESAAAESAMEKAPLIRLYDSAPPADETTVSPSGRPHLRPAQGATAPESAPESASGNGAFSEPPGDGLRGTAIHLALQWLCEERPGDKVKSELGRAVKATDEEAAEWLKVAEKTLNCKTLRPVFDGDLYTQVFNEMPLWFSDGAERVSGRVDRVCVGDDSVWLIDYKTHRNPEDAKEDGARQMALYAKGAAAIWPGRTIRKSLLFTETNELWDC